MAILSLYDLSKFQWAGLSNRLIFLWGVRKMCELYENWMKSIQARELV